MKMMLMTLEKLLKFGEFCVLYRENMKTLA